MIQDLDVDKAGSRRYYAAHHAPKHSSTHPLSLTLRVSPALEAGAMRL